MIAPIVFVASCAVAQSQQPKNQTQTTAAGRQPDVLIGTEGTPAIVRITKSPQESAEEQAARNDEATNRHWNIALTTIIALFTGALIIVGWKQRQTYEATLATNRIIERPYVTMSHEPEGLSLRPNPGPHTAFEVSIKLVNTGHTPADILDLRCVRALSEAEALTELGVPAPARTQPPIITLLPNDSFNYWQRTEVDPGVLDSVKFGTTPFWLVGSVTYRDRFENKRHRQWYGRRYLRDVSGNNLVYVFDDPRFHKFNREEDLD